MVTFLVCMNCYNLNCLLEMVEMIEYISKVHCSLLDGFNETVLLLWAVLAKLKCQQHICNRKKSMVIFLKQSVMTMMIMETRVRMVRLRRSTPARIHQERLTVVTMRSRRKKRRRRRKSLQSREGRRDWRLNSPSSHFGKALANLDPGLEMILVFYYWHLWFERMSQ